MTYSQQRSVLGALRANDRQRTGAESTNILLMSQTLNSITGTSIDYDTCPVAEPPHTKFPYPESKRSTRPPSPVNGDGEDVDATSANRAQSLSNGQANDTAVRKLSPLLLERPDLASKKFETEVPRRVGARPIVSQAPRRSVGAHPNNKDALRRRSSSPSDSWSDSSSSSDEHHEPHAERDRQESNPEHSDFAPRELNRTRVRPWHENRGQQVDIGNEHFSGQGKIAKDGRLKVRLTETADTGYSARALGSAIHGHLHPQVKKAKGTAEARHKRFEEIKSTTTIPRMNIVIMVTGSRGDVQPFLKIGRILQDKYGHRVRIATHPAFRKFVQEEIGLEFFSIGGDPSELMSFMVRNPGLIPSFDTLTSGEVGRRREQMYEMFNGFWRACVNATDDEKDNTNLKMLGNRFPFVADAIIANPVSFAHYHCAEKLGIPLHMVFTFPYTPTAEFPHPLANVKSSNVDREYTNYMSYPLVDLVTWQGLGDLVNRFRVKTLGLEPVSTLWAPGQLTRMRVPMTYLWSPGLVPKPADWGPEVDVAGYVFLDLAKSYKPPDDLSKFLERNDEDTRPIIYIGFGSISGIKDARGFCQLIFDATVQAGVRAVVSRGWGGMGDGMDVPDGVLMVDNVPHDWLFPKLDAVVHHG